MPEIPVQVPGANLRGLLCAGIVYPEALRQYSAPAVVAFNSLIGFRMLPNLMEHLRGCNTAKKESDVASVAHLLFN